MGNLLFSPSGRISTAAFMRGAYILIAVGAVIALSSIVSTTLGTLLGIVSLVTYYCWVVLFVKRYHEGGQSGWMSLVPISIYIVLGLIMLFFVFGGSFLDAIRAGLEAAETGASQAEQSEVIEEAMMAGMGGTGLYLKSAISGALLSFVIAFAFNKVIPVDPGDNQYGPSGNAYTV